MILSERNDQLIVKRKCAIILSNKSERSLMLVVVKIVVNILPIPQKCSKHGGFSIWSMTLGK